MQKIIKVKVKALVGERVWFLDGARYNEEPKVESGIVERIQITASVPERKKSYDDKHYYHIKDCWSYKEDELYVTEKAANVAFQQVLKKREDNKKEELRKISREIRTVVKEYLGPYLKSLKK